MRRLNSYTHGQVGGNRRIDRSHAVAHQPVAFQFVAAIGAARRQCSRSGACLRAGLRHPDSPVNIVPLHRISFIQLPAVSERRSELAEARANRIAPSPVEGIVPVVHEGSGREFRGAFAGRGESAISRFPGNFQDFGYLFVRQPFEISQNHGAAEGGGNSGEGAANGGLHFVRGALLEGLASRSCKCSVSWQAGFFGVDGNLVAVMPPEPAAVVERLAHGDAVEPCFQGASAAESADARKA